jgi:Glu-tRNA(Gln) amidotransferase subunit E-like FAD-binding protein
MHEYVKKHQLPYLWDRDYNKKAKNVIDQYVSEIISKCKTKRELMKKTMNYFKGHVPPKIVSEVIDEKDIF